jgi:LmbE family N-acetylglucosaminyl deacetylase
LRKLVLLLLAAAAGCRASPPASRATAPLGELSPHGAVLWVGAHSDDEALVAGALLARLARSGRPVYVLTMTRGEGTGISGSEDDEGVARIRRREFCLACTLYRARDCASEAFPSRAHLDATGVGFRESPEEVLRIWSRLGPEDPVRTIERWIDLVRPEWILTLDPDHGMYGHPEHAAVGRLALEAARRAPGPYPRKVYAAENRFASLTPGNLDPGPIAAAIPAEVACGDGRTCWQVEAEAAATYASQDLPDLFHRPATERFTFLREIYSRR